MGLSYNDLSLLRYIQKRQRISLSKVALQFQKDEISIRRTIERINLFPQTLGGNTKGLLLKPLNLQGICRLYSADHHG